MPVEFLVVQVQAIYRSDRGQSVNIYFFRMSVYACFMRLSFTKMHGLGNDFIVLDATETPFSLSRDQIRWLSDRHFGVGFDQLLVVEPPAQAGVDFKYRIFNADGGEVEQCGNGARCFARFVREQGLTSAERIRVQTSTGVIELQVRDDGLVTVDMGVPVFAPADIPLDQPSRQARYSLSLDQIGSVEFGAVSMGNPHAVVLVDSLKQAPVEQWGPLIESHPLFPNQVNVGFLQIVDRGYACLRVFERGVGETLACGTGACAAAVIGQVWGLLDQEVVICLPGGELQIRWEGEGRPVMMTGPAETVFTGEIDCPDAD